MRFRPRLGISNWQVFCALSAWTLCLFIQLVRPGNPKRLLVLLSAGFILIFLGAGALPVYSVYWDLTPDCIVMRKLWRKREIPWTEVTRVGWLGNFSGTFSISVGHRIEDYDRLYIEPRDRTRFIAAFRKFAPHATFELE